MVAKYRDAWPIADMILLRLKYTSSRFNSTHRVVPQGPLISIRDALVRFYVYCIYLANITTE